MIDKVLAAKSPAEVFGIPPPGEDPHTFYKAKHRQLSKAFHPDHNPDPRAGKAQAKLNELYQRTLAPATVTLHTRVKSYKLIADPFYTGELASFYSTTGTDDVLKVFHNKADRDLRDNEYKVAQLISPDCPFVPKIGPALNLPDGRPALVMESYRDYVPLGHLTNVPAVQISWMLTRLLTVLAASHAKGFVHGAVTPQHVLVKWDNALGHRWLKLIDWTGAIAVGTDFKLLSPRYKDLYPPEVAARLPATPASDLFMLGGTLLSVMAPGIAPEAFLGILRALTLHNPRRRPQDALEVLGGTVRSTLVCLWGPPAYVPFDHDGAE